MLSIWALGRSHQFADIPLARVSASHGKIEDTYTAVPLARTWSGRISGTYTPGMISLIVLTVKRHSQGIQLAVAPKINIYYVVSSRFLCRLTVKKNVTLAELVDLAILPPRLWKLNKILMSIMLTPNQKEPIIIGLRRPYLSKKKDGNRDPITNMRLITPPRRRERLRVRPTLYWRTEVT